MPLVRSSTVSLVAAGPRGTSNHEPVGSLVPAAYRTWYFVMGAPPSGVVQFSVTTPSPGVAVKFVGAAGTVTVMRT